MTIQNDRVGKLEIEFCCKEFPFIRVFPNNVGIINCRSCNLQCSFDNNRMIKDLIEDWNELVKLRNSSEAKTISEKQRLEDFSDDEMKSIFESLSNIHARENQ